MHRFAQREEDESRCRRVKISNTMANMLDLWSNKTHLRFCISGQSKKTVVLYLQNDPTS